LRFKKTRQNSGVGQRKDSHGQGCGGGADLRSPKGGDTKKHAAPGEWIESKILAVIAGIIDKYFCNLDETNIFVPTKDYGLFDVHERQAMFHCPAERIAGTRPSKRVTTMGMPPLHAMTSPNPFIKCEADIFVSMVTELAAALQVKCHRSYLQDAPAPLPLPPENGR
jgi:hypothetical protein